MVKMTQDEIQAVAQAIEDQLTAEDGWMVGTPALSSMCHDFAQAAIAAVYAPLVESLSNDGELLTIAWMDGSHRSNTAHRARIAELEAEVERLREALVATEGAIAEYYRYWTGGEMRGSYDGKPERASLWKSRQTARTALGASHDA